MAKKIILFTSLLLLFTACGIYTFSGASIQPDVKTITINFAEYTALQVNPSLSSQLTEALKDRFQKSTGLEQVELDGDLELSPTVVGYHVSATAVSANETAEQSRLTISIKLKFQNKKYPEEDFDRNFSAYADFDSSLPLDAKEADLVDEILEKLVDDIFNATVANW